MTAFSFCSDVLLLLYVQVHETHTIYSAKESVRQNKKGYSISKWIIISFDIISF